MVPASLDWGEVERQEEGIRESAAVESFMTSRVAEGGRTDGRSG